MKIQHSILLFIAVIFISACQAPAAEEESIDMDALRAELQAMEDAYAAGENAKDVNAIVKYYAEDAQNLPNNEPTVVGKAAITERLKKQLAADTSGSTISFEVVDVFAAGDLVVEIGSSTTTKPDGSQNTGKYMSVFERRDGKLVCIRDIWNSDDDNDDDNDDDDDDDD